MLPCTYCAEDLFNDIKSDPMDISRHLPNCNKFLIASQIGAIISCVFYFLSENFDSVGTE